MSSDRFLIIIMMAQMWLISVTSDQLVASQCRSRFILLKTLASHDLNICFWLVETDHMSLIGWGTLAWSYPIGCFPLDTNIIWSHNTIPRQAVSCWLAPRAVTYNTCHANPVMKRDRPSVTGMEWILQMKLLVIYSLRDHLLGVTSLLTQHPCNHMFHQTISIAACTHKTRYTILTRHSIMC